MRPGGSLFWLLVAATLGMASLGRADERLVSDRLGTAARSGLLTPAERLLIDEGALWGPREKRNVARVEVYGNALKWLVARTPLPIAEESRRAGQKDDELRSKHRTFAPPARATEVFQKLTAALPARMRPEGIEFTL